MYQPTIKVRVTRASLNAHDFAHRFQKARRAWEKANPDASEMVMPDSLLRLKERAAFYAEENIVALTVKGAMDKYPPLR